MLTNNNFDVRSRLFVEVALLWTLLLFYKFRVFVDHNDVGQGGGGGGGAVNPAAKDLQYFECVGPPSKRAPVSPEAVLLHLWDG
jgi:hypothetical protein